MAKIRNIIFDFGGVILNIDYKKTSEAFTGMGISNFEQMYSQFRADALFEKLETGHTTEMDFYNSMIARCGGKLDENRIRLAWNAMLLDYRMESIEYLKSIKNSFNTYLLSNTNAIHKAAFDKIFTAQTGLPSIDVLFKKTWYSHKIGRRKPYADIYKFILEDEELIAEETLFIDDSEANLTEAAALGIVTHLLLPGERIEKVVPDYLTSS